MVTHRKDHLQGLVDWFCQASQEFGLKLSPTKTNVFEEDVEDSFISITYYEVEDICHFIYLVSTTKETPQLEAELSEHAGRAITMISRIVKRVQQK